MTIEQRSHLMNSLTDNLIARAAHRGGSVEADRLSRAASALVRYQTAVGRAADDLTLFGAPAECGRLAYAAADRRLLTSLQGLGYQSADMAYDAVQARLGRMPYRMHCLLAC